MPLYRSEITHTTHTSHAHAHTDSHMTYTHTTHPGLLIVINAPCMDKMSTAIDTYYIDYLRDTF